MRDVDTTPRTQCADLYAKVDSLGLELRNKLHGAAASELDGKLETKVKDKTAWLDEKFSDVCSLLNKKFTNESVDAEPNGEQRARRWTSASRTRAPVLRRSSRSATSPSRRSS